MPCSTSAPAPGRPAEWSMTWRASRTACWRPACRNDRRFGCWRAGSSGTSRPGGASYPSDRRFAGEEERMKKSFAIPFLLLPVLLLAACSPRLLAATEAPAFYPESVVGFGAGDAVGLEGGRSAEAPSGELAVGQAPTTDERLVVQTAALSMVVADPVAKATAIRQMAEAMGGYVVSSYIFKSTYGDAGQIADNASVMVRIPADRLEDALRQIKADAVEVRSENVSGEDVTAQDVDLESRLRSLEATE